MSSVTLEIELLLKIKVFKSSRLSNASYISDVIPLLDKFKNVNESVSGI